MKPLFALILLALFHSPAQAGQIQIRPEMLKFRFQAFEGGPQLSCIHSQNGSPELNDWKVVCKEPSSSLRKEYRVHLIVSAYSRPQIPKLSYEILYWVTDWTKPSQQPLPIHESTTWIHLQENSPLQALELSESVENGTAALYLTVSG